MAAPVILIQGPQGSGKGTQAKLLAGRLGGVTFSSGELWRASNDPELAQRQAQGALGKSEVIIKLVKDYLVSIPADKVVISDAFPRMLPEAEWLVEFLPTLDRKLKAAVLLTIPHEESMARLLKRAATETDRPDDRPQDIERRLALYEQETSKVVELWRSLGILKEVNGVGSVEEIAGRINKVIDEA
jgi:adenylate kinase